MRTTGLLAGCGLIALAAGWGCQNSAAPTDLGPPVATTTVTITASGASPRNIEIPAGARVRFINNDARAHNMTSDPHPEHDQCLDINQVGFLAPGESRETGNMVEVRTCGFHDHDNPNNANLTGRITTR